MKNRPGKDIIRCHRMVEEGGLEGGLDGFGGLEGGLDGGW